jgi:hypothetical protein
MTDILPDILRIDLVSLFDLDFKSEGIPLSFLKELEDRQKKESEIRRLYASSFDWIFYRLPNNSPSLPDCERYSFSSRINEVEGESVLINRKYGVGVYSIWQKFKKGSFSPMDVKQKPWKDKTWRDYCDISLKGVKGIERNFPFIGILLNTSDVGKYCTEYGVELGRVFTGNLEMEDNAQLEAYIRNNLSRREYERFFLRWTEGLAVYGSNIKDGRIIEEWIYEQSLFRAVQIFETCILVWRLLRKITQSVNDLSNRLSMFTPRPWAVNWLLQGFLQIQLGLVSGPPVQSVEGERLLQAAYASFGIDALVKSTQQSCDFLERRFQWAKTQSLVGVGIFTYVLNIILKALRIT